MFNNNIESEWDLFLQKYDHNTNDDNICDTRDYNSNDNINNISLHSIHEPTELYISTQTKIIYLQTKCIESIGNKEIIIRIDRNITNYSNYHIVIAKYKPSIILVYAPEKSSYKMDIHIESLINQTLHIVQSYQHHAMMDLVHLFWSLAVQNYIEPKEGIIKKQIKMTSTSKEHYDDIDRKLKLENVYNSKLILNERRNINTYNDHNFRFVQKINVGVVKKDILSYRVKERGAFYNCFVIIIRIKDDNEFKEVHIKLFNTGKIEVPGIKNDITLYKAISILLKKYQH